MDLINTMPTRKASCNPQFLEAPDKLQLFMSSPPARPGPVVWPVGGLT